MAIDKSLLDEISKDRENFGGTKTLTWKVPADGKEHQIRILPGFFGKSGKRWYEPLTQHWGPDPDGRGFNIAYPCPREHFGQKECPYCEAWEEYKTQEKTLEENIQHCSDDEEKARIQRKLRKAKALVKDLSYRRAYLHNVIDRDENTPTTRAFFAPKTLWDIFVTAFTNNSEGDIFDPEDGHDFMVKRETKNNRTSYSGSVRLKPSTISEDPAEVKRLMKSRVDFPAEYLSEKPDIEEMRKSVQLLIEGGGSSRSSFKEEEPGKRRDEEDRPTRRRPAEEEEEFRPAKRRSVEEEDRPARRRPVVEEEDEEEFRPAKRKSEDKPKPRKLVEDEDEDDFRPTGNRPGPKRVTLDDEDEPRKPTKGNRDQLLQRFEEDED